MVDADSYRLVTVKRARGGVVERGIFRGGEISVKSQFEIREGDFLISKRQIVHGACGIVPADLSGSIVSNEYAVLTPTAGLDLRFLGYLAHSNYFQQTCFHSSIGVHIEKMIFKLDRWLGWDFNLPPLPEQKKIAEILSTWDRAIETTEKLLANAEAQKKALMQQLLTSKRRLKGFEGEWQEIRLEELAEVNPRRSKSTPDKVSFIGMEDVSERGELIRHRQRSTSELQAGYTCFRDGDVLVAKITPCFENGKGALVTKLMNGVGFGSTEFHVLRPRDQRDTKLIFHITNTHEFRGRGANNMTGSAGQRRVPADYIRSYGLLLPTDPNERKALGFLLDDASLVWTKLTKQRDRLVTEKRALMQQLLTGKRRVKI